ncbi:MAG: hypothetical protein R6V85_06330 [Polyangia bacterium]
MTRRPSIDEERPRASEIWAYYRFAVASLESMQHSIVSSSPEDIARLRTTDGRKIPDDFLGLSREECRAHIARYREELDRQVALLLVASYEACLRVDFETRVRSRRPKGAVTDACRKVADDEDRPLRRIAIDSILDVWKRQDDVPPKKVGAFRQLLGYRNWLAHGRYWIFTDGRMLDPREVQDRADTLFESLDGFTSEWRDRKRPAIVSSAR